MFLKKQPFKFWVEQACVGQSQLEETVVELCQQSQVETIIEFAIVYRINQNQDLLRNSHLNSGRAIWCWVETTRLEQGRAE